MNFALQMYLLAVQCSCSIASLSAIFASFYFDQILRRPLDGLAMNQLLIFVLVGVRH